MTGSDLIVAAPWIIFGVGLAVLCIGLLRTRRSDLRSRCARRRHDDEPRE